MKTLTVPLAEICEVNPSPPNKLGSNDPCSFVPMEAVDDWSATIERTIIRPYQEVAKGFTSFAEHDVLIAKITPCMENGKCAIARRLSNGIGFGSTEFHVLRATNRVLPEWLLYFWRLPATRQLAERNMTGSGGQQRVPTGFLEELAIPLPPIPEQRRIAAQLEQADRLRRTRRYTLELSDTFLPDTFRKLFGDPLREKPRWTPVPIAELCESITDCVNKTAPLSDARTPFKMIRTTNVRNGEVDLSTVRCVNEETFNTWTRRSVPQHDDVILTREAPLGEVGILRHPTNIFLGQRLVQYRTNKNVATPEYLLHALMSPSLQHQLKRLGAGSTVEHIAVPDCETLMVMKAPLDLQQHFAKLVTQHERLRATQRESLRQAEHLFQTLLHRAFAGVE